MQDQGLFAELANTARPVEGQADHAYLARRKPSSAHLII